jgi:geranylgeranyl transferase type-2 subunit beta
MSTAAAPRKEGDPVALATERHVAYVLSLDKCKDTFEYQASEHLRVSGIYWSLSALHLVGRGDALDRAGVLAFVASCQDPRTGGFGGGPDHDPHVLYTLSALQVLAMLDAPRDTVDRAAAARFVARLQQPDGAFVGDAWAEADTRFAYCAVQAAILLAPDAPADAVPEFMVACAGSFFFFFFVFFFFFCLFFFFDV